jgi:hypothetical protein
MLPEALSWFTEFKQIAVAPGDVPAVVVGQSALYTLGRLDADSIPGGQGFSLAQVVCGQLPANDTGTDWYNTGDASIFPWGFAAAAFGDALAGASPTGHMAGIAIIKNHSTPLRQWSIQSAPWSLTLPDVPFGSAAPPSLPFWNILAYLPFPSGSLTSAAFREIERVRSWEADPIRFNPGDSLSVCLVVTDSDASRLNAILANVTLLGYAFTACKIRLPKAQTRWNQ